MSFTKDNILAVVNKHLIKAVDGLNDKTIDPLESMKSYGATSLDIVEVVSSSMRELKIKIPRTELADIKNIQGLADMFYKYQQQEKTQEATA